MNGRGADRAAVAILLRQAVGAAVGLPPADTEQINVLIDAGEMQVALETLCTQVYEYDVELESAQRDSLQELGDVLDVNVRRLLGDWGTAPPGSDGSP